MSKQTDRNTSTRDAVNGLIVSADRAMDDLVAARREVCSEYNERFRKLRDLKAALHANRPQIGELFDVEPLLSDEIKRLLVDPTYSL